MKEQVNLKFNGLCAYTGKPLDEKWQVDHVIPVCNFGITISPECNSREEYEARLKEVDNIENLLPAMRIVNHYKRSLDLEGFRRYMLTFHTRLLSCQRKLWCMKPKGVLNIERGCKAFWDYSR